MKNQYRVIGKPERYQYQPGLWFGPAEPLPGTDNAESLDLAIKQYAAKTGLRYDLAAAELARTNPDLFALYRRHNVKR